MVSAFQMEGLVFSTASLVLTVMDYDPLSKVNFGFLNLCIADIEKTVTSYADFRTQNLQTPRQMIVEIDSLPVRTRFLIPPAKPRRISTSQFPMAAATPKSDMSNSIHPPTVPYLHMLHPPNSDQRAHHPISPIGAPYGTSPSWPHETPGYMRQPYTGALLAPPPSGRLHPDGHKHGYMTRHNTVTGLHPNSHGRDVPPPPYPGLGLHMPFSFSQYDSAQFTPFSGQEVRTDLHSSMNACGSPHVQNSIPKMQGNRSEELPNSGPRPYPVSPTKRLALEKPQPRERSLESRRNSPFYMVGQDINNPFVMVTSCSTTLKMARSMCLSYELVKFSRVAELLFILFLLYQI